MLFTRKEVFGQESLQVASLQYYIQDYYTIDQGIDLQFDPARPQSYFLLLSASKEIVLRNYQTHCNEQTWNCKYTPSLLRVTHDFIFILCQNNQVIVMEKNIGL